MWVPLVCSSCYDWADRLTGSTITNPASGAAPLSATSLRTGNLTYDANGDTTKLADQTFTYDGAGRHTGTTAGDGTTVTVLRDATDRIVQQTSSGVITRYGYSTDGDTADLTLSTTNKIIQRILALPGGVIATLPASGTPTWSYPNLHGDVIATANQTGTRLTRYAYDPFGQPVANQSGPLGTPAANQSVADNLTGSSDYSWLGAGDEQRLYEHAGTLSLIERVPASTYPSSAASSPWTPSPAATTTPISTHPTPSTATT
jgi:YD repeat-containing protein